MSKISAVVCNQCSFQSGWSHHNKQSLKVGLGKKRDKEACSYSGLVLDGSRRLPVPGVLHQSEMTRRKPLFSLVKGT